MNIKQCSTLEDTIEFGLNQDISHSKLFLKSVTNSNNKKITFNYLMLLDEYIDYINKCTEDVELNSEDYLRYRMKPKLYCYEKYGTIEYWSLLLRVNKMISIMDFDVKKFKGFNKEMLESIINEVLILEKNNILENQDYVESEMKKIIR